VAGEKRKLAGHKKGKGMGNSIVFFLRNPNLKYSLYAVAQVLYSTGLNPVIFYNEKESSGGSNRQVYLLAFPLFNQLKWRAENNLKISSFEW
jgi:hypothetical protein